MSWIRDRIRPVVHLARRLRDRGLHPYYRRKSAEALRERRIREIVVLCHGNVCRSPYAENVIRARLAARGVADVFVHSAGFVGPDRSCPADALAVAAERRVDLGAHRSKLVTAQALESADLVIVMSDVQAREVAWRGASSRAIVIVLGDLDPEPIESRVVRDPWNCDRSVFRSTYDRIDRCAEELATIIVSNRR